MQSAGYDSGGVVCLFLIVPVFLTLAFLDPSVPISLTQMFCNCVVFALIISLWRWIQGRTLWPVKGVVRQIAIHLLSITLLFHLAIMVSDPSKLERWGGRRERKLTEKPLPDQ